MGFVIDGLLAVGLTLIAAWAWSLRQSVTRDQQTARERRRQAEEAEAQARREARLFRAGEPLRCLGCDTTFPGPLPETGCPGCHLQALVVTEADYRPEQQATQSVGHTRKEE